MTVNEAINYLEDAKIEFKIPKAAVTARKTNEALEMAIKALDKEPCEDAVSRASVFEILGNLMSIPYDLDRPINKDDVSESMDAIRVLPSVTPAPKKCHNENHDYAEYDQFVCSNCGIELQDWHRVERDEDDGDVTYHGYEFKYCPNCGSFIMKEV